MKKLPAAVFFLGTIFSVLPLHGQTAITTPPNYFDTSGFPQWGQDLRRAEIIAFGTFPFTVFTATFIMDTLRASKHNWDGKYMPWPMKTAGAIGMTNEEQEMVFMTAAAASAILALADFVIVKIKRHRARQRALEIPEGTPIIIRRPLSGGGAEDDAGGAAESPDAAEGPDDAAGEPPDAEGPDDAAAGNPDIPPAAP